jgi:hypothetical protein
MATNVIALNGNFQYQSTGGNSNVPLSVNVPQSGSSGTWTTDNFVSGAWQPLNTSSLSDIRYLVADNVGSGSIKLATDAAGTKQVAWLYPGDNVVIPWSGSTGLYGQAQTVNGMLTYLVVES